MTRPIAVLGSLLTAMTLVLSGLVLATPASAATARNGVCEAGEFCLYFNTGPAGSVSDFTTDVSDYGDTQPGCYDYKTAGQNGYRQCVKNNAAGARNLSSRTVRVYYNSGFDSSHAYQDFAPGTAANFTTTMKNQNAGHRFLAGATGCKTDGTDSIAPSSILVYRTSLKRVDRVDFHSYVKDVLPNEWVSSWPAESLKAGAMAVKDFGWYWALHSTRKTSTGQCFDVYDSTTSQVYRPGSGQSSTTAAVDATWNVRMTRSGAIFQAHYCSTTTACGSSYVPGEWMSQYGSRDMANAGSGYATILRHYYTGITVG